MALYQRSTFGILVEVDGLPLEARDPRPGRHVGDACSRRPRTRTWRAGGRARRRGGAPPSGSAPRRRGPCPCCCAGSGGPGRASGPTPPICHISHCIVCQRPFSSCRPELAGLLGEIHQDGAGFEHGEAVVAVDDRGDAVVRADLEELGLELLVLARCRPDGPCTAARTSSSMIETLRPFGVDHV